MIWFSFPGFLHPDFDFSVVTNIFRAAFRQQVFFFSSINVIGMEHYNCVIFSKKEHSVKMSTHEASPASCPSHATRDHKHCLFSVGIF